MNNKIAALSVVALSLALSACGSTGSVMQMGPDTFTVSAQKHNMSGGAPEAQSNALASANAHCAGLGKELMVKNMSSSFERPFYSYSVTFQCLAKNDPALTRPTYTTTPDVVIENRIK
ncbi:hypothetical protein [Magnetococcus marinus]|uniref:hypothetical protein n=1 Tax=Magnetococcus marinus TaxID=1124597 RepID=UPI00059F7C13|nr:hypothetical protein [Magnetococcus marinus]